MALGPRSSSGRGVGAGAGAGAPSKSVPLCRFWAQGRCTKGRFCRFFHPPDASSDYLNPHPRQIQISKHKTLDHHNPHPPQVISKRKNFVWRKETAPAAATVLGDENNGNAVAFAEENNGKAVAFAEGNNGKAVSFAEENIGKAAALGDEDNDAQNTIMKAQHVCNSWAQGNCGKSDDGCSYLHQWFQGENLSTVAKLQGHYKTVIGTATFFPEGEGLAKLLLSASQDGVIKMWDCNTGLCISELDLGGEAKAAGCLLTEGPWFFVGAPNLVKAFNRVSNAVFDYPIDPCAGQVHTMNIGNDVGNELLLAGTHSGSIYVWKFCSEANAPLQAATEHLKGHSAAVVSLRFGASQLFSGSLDHTIRVWDLNTAQCLRTLNGHSGAVTSLICWDKYLISGSLDDTIKVWAKGATSLEVIYTHNVEEGVLDFAGMTVAENKHMLLCSCNDDSVRLYDLPSFIERGRLFAQKEVRTVEVGPHGLIFTGDASGLVSVWRWVDAVAIKPVEESSS